MIIGIVCVDSKWGIGKDNHLLFNIKEDMNFFKETTKGHIVVMGYNTLLSLPGSKPLKNRTNIVLAPAGVDIEGCFVEHDFNTLVDELKTVGEISDIYIIGGAMFYNSMLPYYDKVLVTKVDEDGEAQVFFPNLDENKSFTITNESDIINTESGHKIRFVTYERLKGAK